MASLYPTLGVHLYPLARPPAGPHAAQQRSHAVPHAPPLLAAHRTSPKSKAARRVRRYSTSGAATASSSSSESMALARMRLPAASKRRPRGEQNLRVKSW